MCNVQLKASLQTPQKRRLSEKGIFYAYETLHSCTNTPHHARGICGIYRRCTVEKQFQIYPIPYLLPSYVPEKVKLKKRKSKIVFTLEENINECK